MCIISPKFQQTLTKTLYISSSPPRSFLAHISSSFQILPLEDSREGETLGQMQHNKPGNITVVLITSEPTLGPDHYYTTMSAFAVASHQERLWPVNGTVSPLFTASAIKVRFYESTETVALENAEAKCRETSGLSVISKKSWQTTKKNERNFPQFWLFSDKIFTL